MNNIYVPSEGSESWRHLLASPEKQWRDGYSAKSLAERWDASDGLPDEVKRVLDASCHGPLKNLCIELGIPEYQVPLPPTKGHPSQNDLFVLASNAAGLVVMMVEGKVDEPFDRTVGEWLTEASQGKKVRLDYLLDCLNLGADVNLGPVRYQLLHRAASAVLTARRFHAQNAVLLVHSFSQTHAWLEDFSRFAKLFNVSIQKPDEIAHLANLENVSLYAAWICG